VIQHSFNRSVATVFLSLAGEDFTDQVIHHILSIAQSRETPLLWNEDDYLKEGEELSFQSLRREEPLCYLGQRKQFGQLPAVFNRSGARNPFATRIGMCLNSFNRSVARTLLLPAE
jgi:hypothetical protein